jgi:hypothetical protein
LFPSAWVTKCNRLFVNVQISNSGF